MPRGVRRTLTAVAAAELVPVPLLDTWLQNQARRWLVNTVADRFRPPADERAATLDRRAEQLRNIAAQVHREQTVAQLSELAAQQEGSIPLARAALTMPTFLPSLISQTALPPN